MNVPNTSSSVAKEPNVEPTADAGAPPRGPKLRRDRVQQAVEWFDALPRVGKWIVLAAIGAGVLLLFRNVVWPRADALNTRADRTEALIEASVRRAEALPSSVVDRALAYGPNSVPGREAAAKDKFANAVAAIMSKRGVGTYGFDVRSSQGLSGDVLPTVAAELNGTMARTIAELKFEASGETVNGIISDLERSPDVDAITDLRLTYSNKTKRVAAALSIERWGVSQRGGGS